jgi:alkylation response protein AidB-like acyl-CoA dehydrogenase
MTFFGFALTGVPLGVARRAVEGLRVLGVEKQVPGRGKLSDDGYVRYAVAKAQVLLEAARANLHASFEPIWQAAIEEREVDMPARARLRRAGVHAIESSIEAVNLCYRAAGGSALFSTAPFEAALRDVNAMSGHVVFQRRMMEEAGGVAFGATPTIPVF